MTGLEHDIKELKDHYERQASLFTAGTQKAIAYKKWYLKQLNLIAYKYKHLEGTAAQSALTALAIQRRSLEQSLPGRFKGIRRLFNNLRTAIFGNKAEERYTGQQADGRQRILYQLREAGLGKMIDQAEKSMKNGVPAFTLSDSQEVAKDKSFTAQVGFAKDDTGRYTMTYKAQMAIAGREGVKKRSLDNGENGLLSNERAISLLSGRAVKQPYYIQGQEHAEWLLLDFSDLNANGAARFRRFDSTFGYDLLTSLEVLDAHGSLREEQKENIIRKLENGHQVNVLLTDQGKDTVVRISADPVGKGFIYYDDQGKQTTRQKALGKESAQTNNIRVSVPRPAPKLKMHK